MARQHSDAWRPRADSWQPFLSFNLRFHPQGGRVGGSKHENGRVAARRSKRPLPNPPPRIDWGWFEQKLTRFLQRTDQRSGMNGHGTPGPGVTVAGERLLAATGSIAGCRLKRLSTSDVSYCG